MLTGSATYVTPLISSDVEIKAGSSPAHGGTSSGVSPPGEPSWSPPSVATGQVYSSLHRRHRAIEFRKFLNQLDRDVPAEHQLHLILDNYATHKTPDIRRWLARHPRFHLHFTPTSSSWLNLVERFFAELTTRLLRRGVHHSVAELEADIRAWIDNWNDNPRPYVWTKTAEQILESIGSYCQRLLHSTNDSGH